MTNERARDLALRAIAIGSTHAITAVAALADRILGGSPKLRPPAFDEAEAQRFLSDGAEQLAVTEERDEVSEPVRSNACGCGYAYKCHRHAWGATGDGRLCSCGHEGYKHGRTPISSPCDAVDCECTDGDWAARILPSNPASAARPPKPSTGGATNSAPGSRSEAPVAADEIQDQADAAVVSEVLAEHYYCPADHSSIGIEGHCGCGGRPIDLRDWQEHVAPLIVAALQQ